MGGTLNTILRLALGAALLAGIFVALYITGALVGEIAPWGARLYDLLVSLVAARGLQKRAHCVGFRRRKHLVR